jgi:bifunctional N-acetylglucosamine-1-phosphate-uridyltransferase/glucosamine-1-phosphate-acetyltransferase GlmU-like protein
MSYPCHGITQDVPADSLALGRSRQVVKEGWATRLRGLKALGKKGRSQ